ncbi:MAG: hypothetical protein JWM19_6333, partial [Actinomycetia bacterium]|nr:hypothetical protein [Actinomycetes bacterium]
VGWLRPGQPEITVTVSESVTVIEEADDAATEPADGTAESPDGTDAPVSASHPE